MEKQPSKLAFGRRNYQIMIAGLIVIALGLFIMTLDKEQYGIGFMGITLGPIVLMLGFVIEFFAIFARSAPKNDIR